MGDAHRREQAEKHENGNESDEADGGLTPPNRCCCARRSLAHAERTRTRGATYAHRGVGRERTFDDRHTCDECATSFVRLLLGQEQYMLEILLIVLIVVLLFGGGGYYWRGRRI